MRRLVGTTVGLALALAVGGCGGAGGPDDGTGRGPGAVLVAPAETVEGACPAEQAGTVCAETPGRGRVSYHTDDLQRLRVDEASYEKPPGQDQWTVTLRLEEDSIEKFGELTRAAAQEQGQVVLLADGSPDVIAAPTVTAAITGGEVQIVVADGRAQARRIVSLITSGDG